MSSNSSTDSVETTSRLAQWRIDNLASFTYRKSNPFKIGKWNWHLSVEKNRTLFVRLFPDISDVTRENPPVASFRIKVIVSSNSLGDRKCLVHPEVFEKQLKSNEDFVWSLDVLLIGKFIIEVEFLDLKIASPDGSGLHSIWAEGRAKKKSNDKAMTLLDRMLSENVHTDTTINTSNGKISAHRSILASRSPVFRELFSHHHQSKQCPSFVDISDMSTEACRAFLGYLYGNIGDKEFKVHRLSLLGAAEKYDVSDLRDACHESLLEDIDSRNVLERLRCASEFRLHELRRSCVRYLVRFGKIYDVVRDDFNLFLLCGDREVITEVFDEVLDAWRGF